MKFRQDPAETNAPGCPINDDRMLGQCLIPSELPGTFPTPNFRGGTENIHSTQRNEPLIHSFIEDDVSSQRERCFRIESGIASKRTDLPGRADAATPPRRRGFSRA